MKDINQLRYAMFCAKRGKIESHQLPPCRDSVQNHIRRANYQCFVWKQCLEQFPDIPDLEDHGWKYENGSVSIIWMNGPPAPEAVLNLLSCNCSRRCTEGNCSCLMNGLKCTDMCKLKNCDNSAQDDDDEIDVNDEDEVEEDDDFDDI